MLIGAGSFAKIESFTKTPGQNTQLERLDIVRLAIVMQNIKNIIDICLKAYLNSNQITWYQQSSQHEEVLLTSSGTYRVFAGYSFADSVAIIDRNTEKQHRQSLLRCHVKQNKSGFTTKNKVYNRLGRIEISTGFFCRWPE